MITATEELVPGAEATLEPTAKQPREKTDYSENIDLSKIPENQRTRIGMAKEVIRILSLSADDVELHAYDAFGPMELPGRYFFESPACQIEFKPGWGTCTISFTLQGQNFSMPMKTPTSKDEFMEQLGLIHSFSSEYLRALDSSTRNAKVLDLRKQMNPVLSEDL